VIWGNARRVLLVRHSYGAENWELPGGAAERDESVLETAIREVREETGLDVVPSCLASTTLGATTDIISCSFAGLRQPIRHRDPPLPRLRIAGSGPSAIYLGRSATLRSGESKTRCLRGRGSSLPT